MKVRIYYLLNNWKIKIWNGLINSTNKCVFDKSVEGGWGEKNRQHNYVNLCLCKNVSVIETLLQYSNADYTGIEPRDWIMDLMKFTCFTWTKCYKHSSKKQLFTPRAGYSPCVVEMVGLFFLCSINKVLCFFCIFGLSDHGREAAVFGDDEAQAQTPKKEEEEGPQRAHEACVSLRPVLQRHPGGH